VLEGDPGKKGAITLRLQFPANYTVPPHLHSMTERVTVLSGTLQVGRGDTLRSSGEPGAAPGRVRVAAREDAPLRVDGDPDRPSNQSGRTVRHL
jgi:hypothetical protein